MVDYWLGPKWDGIDDNNPARIAYIIALQCELHQLGFGINEDSFLSAAKGVYDEEIIADRYSSMPINAPALAWIMEDAK